MIIRRAGLSDLNGVNELLRQVLAVHHKGRPDLFREEGKKYTDEELSAIFADDERPVFVAVDEKVIGYAFCVFVRHDGDHVLCDHTSLYIDDLCVDEKARGKKVGKALFDFVQKYAKENNCRSVTLNVWECNLGARVFYEKMGLVPYKTCMEKLL